MPELRNLCARGVVLTFLGGREGVDLYQKFVAVYGFSLLLGVDFEIRNYSNSIYISRHDKTTVGLDQIILGIRSLHLEHEHDRRQVSQSNHCVSLFVEQVGLELQSIYWLHSH